MGRLTMPDENETKPKEFSLHWGSGIVEEEVQITTEFHKPTLSFSNILRVTPPVAVPSDFAIMTIAAVSSDRP
jgi:hypothetical protein